MIKIKDLKAYLNSLPSTWDDKEFHCCESLNGKVESICLIDNGGYYCLKESGREGAYIINENRTSKI